MRRTVPGASAAGVDDPGSVWYNPGLLTVTIRPNLPNAPLGEVVFELRFPGDLRLPGLWGEFQAAVALEFPNLLVPKMNEGDPIALKPFHLSSDDGSEQIALAVHSFAYISKRYTQFDGFRARFKSLVTLFFARFTPRHVTRAGLRYINWLPDSFPGVRTPDQLHPCLNLRLSGVPASLSVTQPVLVSQFASETGEQLTIQLGKDQPGRIRLDFDCSRDRPLASGEVMDALDSLHNTIDAAFFGMVTSDYLRYMKGENL